MMTKGRETIKMRAANLLDESIKMLSEDMGFSEQPFRDNFEGFCKLCDHYVAIGYTIEEAEDLAIKDWTFLELV